MDQEEFQLTIILINTICLCDDLCGSWYWTSSPIAEDTQEIQQNPGNEAYLGDR